MMTRLKGNTVGVRTLIPLRLSHLGIRVWVHFSGWQAQWCYDQCGFSYVGTYHFPHPMHEPQNSDARDHVFQRHRQPLYEMELVEAFEMLVCSLLVSFLRLLRTF